MAPATTTTPAPSSSISIPTTFKAYQYESYGDATEVLKINPAVDQPTLGVTQVRVQVHAAALNPADVGLVEIYGELATGSKPTAEQPYRIGFDAAGTIVEIGADACMGKLQVGDEVYFMTPFTNFGTFAEFVDVDEECVALKPKNLSFDQAAGVPAVGLTSYQALVHHAQLKRGESVLVLGGSSATGIFGIQIAKLLGAHVTATTSSRNAAFVKSLGADEVIDYTATKWGDVVPPHSINVLYDCGIEPNSWNDGDAQRVLKRGESGRFVTLNPVPTPVAASTFGAAFVGHIHVVPSLADLDALTQHIEMGEISPVVDSVYHFEDLATAIAKSKTRRAVGKLVVKVVSG